MIMKKLVVAAGIVAGIAFGVPAIAQTKPTISVIAKDTTSPYWQAVLAGARKPVRTSASTLSSSARNPNPRKRVKSASSQRRCLEPAAIVIAPRNLQHLKADR